MDYLLLILVLISFLAGFVFNKFLFSPKPSKQISNSEPEESKKKKEDQDENEAAGPGEYKLVRSNYLQLR